MGSTTPYSLPYPEYATGADPKRDIQLLAEGVAPKLYRAEPLTAAQIAAISSPRIGHLALNTDTGRVQFWNGTAWGNVGGSAFGTFTFPTMTVTTTPQEVSFFVGLGFQEINFSIGLNNATSGANITAVSDATKARGLYFVSTGLSRIFNPSSTSDSITFPPAAGGTQPSVYNIRLGADGFLRFNIVSTGTSNLSAADRINWGAR